MAIKKITYNQKVSITTSLLPKENQVTSNDLNEIKDVINNNADESQGIQSDLNILNTNVANFISGATSGSITMGNSSKINGISIYVIEKGQSTASIPNGSLIFEKE